MSKEKMNIRMRRKADAKRHNNRRILLSELTHIQSEIYRKHKVHVRVLYDDTNQSVINEIGRLKSIFPSDNPPPKKVAVIGGVSVARLQLAAIAAMAGIGGL